MPNALQVCGWSHLFGNLMKSAAYATSNWPILLRGMRILCNFFRNDSWRQNIKDKLRGKVPSIDALLLSFTSTLAKWRFETLHDVQQSLLRLRVLCQEHLKDACSLFKDFQEPQTLKDFATACKWDHLWQWMASFFRFVLRPLEKGRRWGLLCACCEEERQAGGYFSRTHHSSLPPSCP